MRKADYLSLAKAFKYHLDEEFSAALLDKQTVYHSSNMQGCPSHQQDEKRGSRKRHQNKKRQDSTEILPSLIIENGKTHSGSGISRLGCMHH